MVRSILHTTVSVLIGGTLLFALQAGVYGQTTGSEEIFGTPKVYKLDTRTIGMGDATVADPSYLTSMNINPAALPFARNLRTVQINLFHDWDQNLAWENISFPVYASRNHTIAAQIGHHHTELSTVQFLDNNPAAQPVFNTFQADLAYALSLYDVVSLGVLSNVSFAHNKHSQFWSSFVTLGILYAPSQSISYGVAFRGLGRSITYSTIPDGRTGLGTQNLRESLEIGATLHFPVDTDRTWMSLSMANEKRFGEKGIWYKGGLEAYVTHYLALRSGLQLRIESRNTPENNVFAPRFGIGILARTFTIDYSFSTSNRLYKGFHQFGFTVGF